MTGQGWQSTVSESPFTQAPMTPQRNTSSPFMPPNSSRNQVDAFGQQRMMSPFSPQVTIAGTITEFAYVNAVFSTAVPIATYRYSSSWLSSKHVGHRKCAGHRIVQCSCLHPRNSHFSAELAGLLYVVTPQGSWLHLLLRSLQPCACLSRQGSAG